MDSNLEEFDRRLRSYVYDETLRRGSPPAIAETVQALAAPIEQVRSAFERLAAAHVLVLQPDSGEILMANPFSAVPTPFLVETQDYSCFANCIWDALGVPAMLHKDARIRTACGDCGASMALEVVNGSLQGDSGVIHFAIPALHWWDDIVFN